MKYTIDVDTKTFIRFWLVILGLGMLGLFIWSARTGLIIVGTSIFLAIAIQPLAKKVKRFTGKQDSSFASAMAYGIIILVIGIILAVVAPVVIDETMGFVRQLPETFEHNLGGWDAINSFGQMFGANDLQSDILNAVSSFSIGFVNNLSNILVTGIGAVAEVVTVVIVTLVLTLLFAIEGHGIMDEVWKLVARKEKPSAVKVYQRFVDRLANVISTYVTKQATVALIDGVVVGVAVLLLSLIFGLQNNLALPMGMIAAVFYLIPMFGPIISCVLVSALLFFSSPIAAVIYLVFYIIYSQIENNVIAPKLQSDAQGLPTAVILAAIIIGMYMFGLIGAIIAIPIAGCIKVVLEELPALKEAKE